MKKLSLIIAVFFTGILTSTAQEGFRIPKTNQLWKNKSEAQLQVNTRESKDLKGPAAKNATPGEKKQGNPVAVKTEPRKELKGPAYKNRKSWNN